jgi:hypothetical protein
MPELCIRWGRPGAQVFGLKKSTRKTAGQWLRRTESSMRLGLLEMDCSSPILCLIRYGPTIVRVTAKVWAGYSTTFISVVAQKARAQAHRISR